MPEQPLSHIPFRKGLSPFSPHSPFPAKGESTPDKRPPDTLPPVRTPQQNRTEYHQAIERICGEPAFIHRQQEGMARESRKEPLMQGGGLCRGLQPLPHGG